MDLGSPRTRREQLAETLPTNISECPPILLSPPEVGDRERSAILRALDSGWIAPAGSELDNFEQEICDYIGAEAVLATNSGTGALHLALLALGLKPGDEVVVQTATFAASAFAVCHAQCVPVFCDTEASTGMIDTDVLADFLRRRAKFGRLPAAVMSVDLYGFCADYDALHQVCDPYGIPIIQDAAEAIGAVSGGKAAGTHGAMGVFSFNGNKIITTSAGGALVGTRLQIERARKLATQAKEDAPYYEHHEIGFNYRMSNLLAALGRAQLEGLPARIEGRRRVSESYHSLLPEIEWMPRGVTEKPNNWLNVGLVPEGIDPASIVEYMTKNKIEVRRAWKPMHLQPVFRDTGFIGGSHAERFFDRGLSFPSSQQLSDAQIRRVARLVRPLLSGAIDLRGN